MKQLLIAIDGTSGVGKGTMARLIAQKYNCQRLDSGAIYRASALYLQGLGYNLEQVVNDQEKIEEVSGKLETLPLSFIEDQEQVLQVILDGENVTAKIRLETTAAKASLIAKIPEVRQALLTRQRKFAQEYSRLVVEGRDMGTVVFPQADIKFFLDASPEAKAQRRYKELLEKGENPDYQEILTLLQERDFQDKNRKVAPLVAADDAIVIDTTAYNIEENFALMDKIIQERLVKD
ncbi:(d)CMP kinase [Psittacicella gerlachiana]|uniref:Cytidylate kinase n=1 Tax=Psittacicella gerlachiana TaxID=2028574 RepID=A0A3A1YBC4_9GAMM|nr:(d)CMP kinase [Psittacicella gerlachiana]RIY34656.1 cytidylate kinase [Psittacicella gerlachiana]